MNNWKCMTDNWKRNMEKWKPLLIRIMTPPLWLMFLLTAFCAAALTAVFLNGLDGSVPAYILYVLSAYTLTVDCILCARIFPKFRRQMKQKVWENPIGNRYMTDIWYRTRVSLYRSLAINLFYSLFKLGTGIWYRSVWVSSVAVYYILLSVMRFLLLRYMRQNEKDRILEYRKYRLCAYLLLVMNIALAGMVILMICENEGFSYPGFLIFAAAAYTFYNISMSIVNVIRYRKWNSPVLSAAKMINLVVAMVSILSLQTAMIAQFGTDEKFRLIMNSLTGAGVCVVVHGLAIFMLVHSKCEINRLQQSV